MHSAWKLLSQCRHTRPTPGQHGAGSEYCCFTDSSTSAVSLRKALEQQACACKGCTHCSHLSRMYRALPKLWHIALYRSICRQQPGTTGCV